MIQFESEMFTATDCERLKQATFVGEVEVFAELPSTNDRAMEMALENQCPKPLLVVAERQTAGRGRGANRWWSSDGALTFSLLVDNVPADASSLISLAIGVAVGDAIGILSPRTEVGLKWPNDVYVSGRKIAGILLERPARLNSNLVIGIGLNVNNSIQNAPAEIADTATSLIDATGQPQDRLAVLIEVLNQVEQVMGALQSDRHQLCERWRKGCIMQGRDVVVEAGTSRTSGMCEGIDDDGGLILQTPTGRVKCKTGVVKSIG